MTVFYKDDVDTPAAGALSNTQQLLLHIQSPNQSSLLLSAPKSVLPPAFYSSLYHYARCFLLFQGGCRHSQDALFSRFWMEATIET